MLPSICPAVALGAEARPRFVKFWPDLHPSWPDRAHFWRNSIQVGRLGPPYFRRMRPSSVQNRPIWAEIGSRRAEVGLNSPRRLDFGPNLKSQSKSLFNNLGETAELAGFCEDKIPRLAANTCSGNFSNSFVKCASLRHYRLVIGHQHLISRQARSGFTMHAPNGASPLHAFNDFAGGAKVNEPLGQLSGGKHLQYRAPYAYATPRHQQRGLLENLTHSQTLGAASPASHRRCRRVPGYFPEVSDESR